MFIITSGRVDGLILVRTRTEDGDEAYQRLGVFWEAKKEAFDGLEKTGLTLV